MIIEKDQNNQIKNVKGSTHSNPKNQIGSYLYNFSLSQKWSKVIYDIEEYLPHYNNSALNNILTDKTALKKQKKLKKLTRLGIPNNLRGYVWQKFASIENDKNKIKYSELCQKKSSLSFLKNEDDIIKDLYRTSHSTFFQEKKGLGQSSLYNVLATFSQQNEIGYVQGMSFFAACLLSYMDEESSYWMLYYLMEKYKMKGFFQTGFPGLSRAYYQLLKLMKVHLPTVYDVLKKWNVYPDYYASQWFLTLFFLNVEYEIFLRIFDIFLLEKHIKVVLRISLGLLKLNESKIINAENFDDLMTVLQNLGRGINANDLFRNVFEFKFSKKLIDEYEKQYEQLKLSKEKNEIMEQLFS